MPALLTAAQPLLALVLVQCPLEGDAAADQAIIDAMFGSEDSEVPMDWSSDTGGQGLMLG